MKKLLSGIFILACGATWIQADIKCPLFRAVPAPFLFLSTHKKPRR
ncbi:hypothetical protein [Candidatus Avelusimicrobium faecicola]